MGAARDDIAESDHDLIARAHQVIEEEKYMEAARLLRKLQDKSLILQENKLQHSFQIGQEMEEMLQKELDDTVSPIEAGWKKQGDVHNTYDAQIHYKVDAKNLLTFRIDVVIEEKLLIPLLSVMQETSLYSTWMPSWKHPRLGIRQSLQLHDLGRGHQIILVTVDMPPPFAAREAALYALAVDDIDTSSAILIQSKHVEPGPYIGNDDMQIPPPEKNIVRLDFDCGMVIRSCPEDHPVLQKSTKVYPPNEKKLLLTIKNMVDAKVKYVPLTIINFFTRQVIKQLLASLLKVAEDVQRGERVQHKEAIESNPELYEWIKSRIEFMLSKCREE